MRKLAGPMMAAAGLRLGLLAAVYWRTGTAVMMQGDTESYLRPGWALLRFGSFSSGGLPELDRTPGYPVFAMLMGMLWGNALAVAVAQIALCVASVWLVARIAELVFPAAGRGVGLAAAWLFAFEPVSVVYSVRLMPETVFVFLLLVAAERLVVFQRTGGWTRVVVAGLGLAGATFVRPVSYYLVPLLALWVAVGAGRKWKAAGVLLAVAMPCLGAWQARNWVEAGYGGFSSVVEKNLYFFQAAEVTAELRGVPLAAVQRELGYGDEADYLAVHPEQRGWTQAARLGWMRRAAMETLREHPWRYARSHVAGVGVVAFTPCAAEWMELLGLDRSGGAMPKRVVNEGVVASVGRILASRPGVAAWMAVLEGYLLVLYGLAVWRFWAGGGGKTAVWMLAGLGLYFLVVSGGAQAVGRYRLPVMPEVCVLAAGGWAAVRRGRVSTTRAGDADIFPSHPSDKNKGAARVGHPEGWPGENEPRRVVLDCSVFTSVGWYRCQLWTWRDGLLFRC